MALPIVTAGELITAARWNDVTATVNNLVARVAELEQGGKGGLRITQVLPPGIVTAGDTIRISGSGFEYTRGAHSVFFGSTRATEFASDSSNSLLIVTIPAVVNGATPSGASITMTVGNLQEFATAPLTIKSKPDVTTGGVQFTFKGSRPTTPTQNASILYDFELKSFASQDLVVTITPNVQIIPPLPPGIPDPGPFDGLAVLDSDATVRADRQIQLAEGATKSISVRLTVPNQTNGVRYGLSATASAPGVTPVAESLPNQEVGQQGEQPDPTVTNFEFASFAAGDGSFSTNTGGVSGVDGTISVRQGTLATVGMRTAFGNIPVGTANNYQLSGMVASPANGWSAAVNAVMQNPLRIQGPGGLTEIFFDIAAPGAAATAILRLSVTRQGAAANNTRGVAYRLVVLP